MIDATEFNIRLNGYGVVSLEQGIQEFGESNGASRCLPAGEVLSRHNLSDGEFTGKPDDVGQAELPEPLALPPYLCLFAVNHLEELLHVAFGIDPHLICGKHGTSLRLTAGIADLRCPVTHDENHLMPQLLKLMKFAESDHVAEMNIGTAGVEALL